MPISADLTTPVEVCVFASFCLPGFYSFYASCDFGGIAAILCCCAAIDLDWLIVFDSDSTSGSLRTFDCTSAACETKVSFCNGEPISSAI